MMTKEEYKALFDGLLNTNLFNFGILLSAHNLEEKDKIDILDYLTVRGQLDFGREVHLISDKAVDGDIDVITHDFNPDFMPNFKYSNPLFICNFVLPYFEIDDWHKRMIDMMNYYKYCYIGFCNRQMLNIYE